MPHPGDLSDFGEIREQSPSQSGDPHRQYWRRGRNPQTDQTDWETARGLRQKPKITRCGKFRICPPGRYFGLWRNPRAVAQSVWELRPHRQYCRRGINAQTDQADWAAARGCLRRPKTCGGEILNFPIRWIFRGLAKPTSIRPVRLGISAAPTIFPAWQKPNE